MVTLWSSSGSSTPKLNLVFLCRKPRPITKFWNCQKRHRGSLLPTLMTWSHLTPRHSNESLTSFLVSKTIQRTRSLTLTQFRAYSKCYPRPNVRVWTFPTKNAWDGSEKTTNQMRTYTLAKWTEPSTGPKYGSHLKKGTTQNRQSEWSAPANPRKTTGTAQSKLPEISWSSCRWTRVTRRWQSSKQTSSLIASSLHIRMT